ncbi:MAG TPA: YceD family protein [Burkholderiales bacterium]
MSHQPVIDGFEFASAGATQQGVLPLSGFERLRDMLASREGEVAYELKGVRDERGRPGLRLRVEATLQLCCQRCLGALAFEVRADELLVLAATQAEIDADPTDVASPDRVLGTKAMAVADLVEDELILSLPYAPRHDECAPAAREGEGATARPFAGLRDKMMKH